MEEQKNNINEYDEAEARAYKKIFSINENLEDKKENIIDANKLDEAEAFVYKDIFAIYDKKTNHYLQVTAQIDKEKEEIKVDVKENLENEIDKILNELIKRNDIKGITVDIRMNDKTETYKTNLELGISINDAVNKIRETIKSFEDIVIVYSKQDLELLQKQFREDNGLEVVKESKTTDHKNYSSIRAEFIEQIKNNESLSKGYIRISDEDFTNLGDILDKNEIPYLAKGSELKDGVNIIVPIEKMEVLKEIFVDNNIKCKQIVNGNVDWNEIKGTKNIFEYVTKEELRKFQELNNDKFKYIAFENKNKYAVYLENSCDISIVGRKKSFNINNTNKKTMDDLKRDVEIHKSNNTSKTNNEKIKVEKER